MLQEPTLPDVASPDLATVLDRYATLDVEAAAERFVDEAPHSALVALARHAIVAHRRNVTRAAERNFADAADAVAAAEPESTSPPAGSAPAPASRRRARRRRPVSPALLDRIGERHTALLDRDLWTGSRWVKYRAVTPEHLRERLAYLEGLRNGLTTTITATRRILAVLEASGAATLGALPLDRLADACSALGDS